MYTLRRKRKGNTFFGIASVYLLSKFIKNKINTCYAS